MTHTPHEPTSRQSPSVHCGWHAIVKPALIGIFSLLMCHGLVVHFRIITDPRPIEYREGAQLLLTKKILEGKDIYAFENQPYTLNVYGIAYHKLASLVTPGSGESYLPMRLLTAFFILLSCILMVMMFERNRTGLTAGLVAAGVWYALTLRLFGICSRPDMMALFFYLCAMFIPWKMRFDNRSIAISCVCSTLAFLTKPYFAAGIIFVLAYLFLQRRYLRFTGASFAFALVFSGSLVLTCLSLEAYLYNTVFISLGYTGSKIQWHWLSMQIVRFIAINIPLIAAIAWVFLRVRGGGTSRQTPKGLPARLQSLGYLTVAGTCATVILLKIAQNRGSHEYFFHLLSPIVLVGGYRWLAAHRQTTLALLAGVLQAGMLAAPFPDYKNAEWNAVEEVIGKERDILHSPTTVRYALSRGEVVHDSGQTEYFHYGLAKGGRLFPEAAVAWKSFQDDLASKVANREFQLVLLNKNMPSIVDREVLRQTYQLTGTMRAPLHRHRNNVLELWRPIAPRE
jgi:hypothetical protein